MRDCLSSTFHALADPTRRAILARLAVGEASVGELAKPFDMSVRAVSKHVGVLQDAGLVSRSIDAQRRLSRLESAPLKELDHWLDGYRLLWTCRLDRLGLVLDAIKERDENEKPG